MPFLTAEEKQTLLDRYFDIEWSDDVSDLRCVRCHRVAINHFVSNCQHIFCQTCSKFYSDAERQSNCPQCQEHVSQLNDQDFEVDVRIHLLKIVCPNKKYGCYYSDQLRKLPSHLMMCVHTKEAALPQESPETTTQLDVINQITNLNSTIGELKEDVRVVKDKVNQLERKVDDSDGKNNASTSENIKVEGRKSDRQLASNNYEEFQSIRSQLLESVNQRIQQNESVVRETMEQMSLNMEEMKTKMASMSQEIETLKNKTSGEKTSGEISLKAQSYEWTIKEVNGTYDSEIFTLPGFKYDTTARITHYSHSFVIILQFKHQNSHTINEFLNNEVFGAVKYIIRDQSNSQQKKDILCKSFLRFTEDRGHSDWIFKYTLPNEIKSPPYLMEDCIKITIEFEPRSIDRSFGSNDGILEWRVDNYRKKMKEQLYSPIYSPTFYTSPRGYRVIIKLSISGALFMDITPYFLTSENDGRLPLTFPRKTTFTLINQTDPSKSIVKSSQCKTFKINTITLSSINSMEQCGFIKDDSIILRVVIEPEASE